MKKLLSLTLALIMVLSLSVAVFAADPDPYYPDDMSQVTINVTYKAANTETTSPAEDFTFNYTKTEVTNAATGVDVDDMPDLTIGNAHFDEGVAQTSPATANGSVTISLPAVASFPSVGIYTYIIRPQAGNTAGVTYYAEDIRLVITVIEATGGKRRIAAVHTETDGGKKANNIDYLYSAGKLNVTKVVDGNLGDRDKEFNVTVTFTAPANEKVKSVISYTDGTTKTIEISAWKEENGSKQAEVTIALKHNETVTFTNIPYDVTYEVVEADYTSTENGKYDAAKYNFTDAAKKVDSASDTVTITNTKNSPVDTGIALDSLPYVLLIAIAVVGVVIFTSRKRSRREY